ncbi:uncharacterized protein FIBRA_06398 [Fibroporia radiculosa]|uniref:SAM domain-containing protein n=1 Tax=Fibroporia radiculosa TaxID=599839 RepID=J4IB87_9APHY|nr:uncharacterized protein FIBRA_06398 [Fibroporia radiculosa]CCM04231.1 predicted protein [Fibroporia radiculosa]
MSLTPSTAYLGYRRTLSESSKQTQMLCLVSDRPRDPSDWTEEHVKSYMKRLSLRSTTELEDWITDQHLTGRFFIQLNSEEIYRFGHSLELNRDIQELSQSLRERADHISSPIKIRPPKVWNLFDPVASITTAKSHISNKIEETSVHSASSSRDNEDPVNNLQDRAQTAGTKLGDHGGARIHGI